eukprot:scaffold4425_cov281-Chaetoceros_neogracile.AAC.8
MSPTSHPEEYLDPRYWNPQCSNFELIDWARWKAQNPRASIPAVRYIKAMVAKIRSNRAAGKTAGGFKTVYVGKDQSSVLIMDVVLLTSNASRM